MTDPRRPIGRLDQHTGLVYPLAHSADDMPRPRSVSLTADPDGPDLTPAEQAGLDALCAAVTAEIGDEHLWHGASDLQWIIESALYQLGRLIRTQGAPLTLPALGTFRRHHMQTSGTGQTGVLISYEPDPLLLEDAL